MPESNLPDDSGTADTSEISLEEAARQLTERSSQQATATSSDGNVGQDQGGTAREEAQPKEQDAQPDEDTPDWDKPDQEPDDESEEGPDAAKDGGRYASLKAKVKLPDGTEQTVGDLYQGSLRLQDYTRKTMETAEVRRGYEQREAGLNQREQQLASQADLLIGLMSELVPPEWTAEQRRNDPLGFIEASAERDAFIRKIQGLDQYRNQTLTEAQQRHQYESSIAFDEHIRGEMSRLIQVMPKLQDEKVRKGFVDDVISGLKQHYGYTDQELTGLNDHKHFLVTADALRYRRLMANKSAGKAKVNENRPAVIRPGRRQEVGAAQSVAAKAAQQKFQKSGDLYDAVDHLMALNASRRP